MTDQFIHISEPDQERWKNIPQRDDPHPDDKPLEMTINCQVETLPREEHWGTRLVVMPRRWFWRHPWAYSWFIRHLPALLQKPFLIEREMDVTVTFVEPDDIEA